MFQETRDNEEYLYKTQDTRFLYYNDDTHLEGSAKEHAICLYPKISIGHTILLYFSILANSKLFLSFTSSGQK